MQYAKDTMIASKTTSQQLLDTDTLLQKVEQLQHENSYLKEQLEWFKRQIFGQKADKFVSTHSEKQLCFEGFDKIAPAEPENKQTISEHERQKRKPTGADAIKFPADLPVEQTVIDLSEQAKVCPETGKPLVKIGEEVTSKLAHKPGSYFIKQIVRPKYASAEREEAGIFTADLPEGLLKRCQADESLLADILVRKFGDHLPLYRQQEIMERQGIHISRQTLSKWVMRAGLALKPLYDLMGEKILQSDNVFYDETPIDMLDPGAGKTKTAYMWVLAGGKEANPSFRIYDFQLNRCHIHAVKMLENYRGILHSDKYGAYEALANQKKLTWCPCWSHIRRKFVEAESGDPPFREWVLIKINKLFSLEEEGWQLGEEERLKFRQEKEAPIIDELIEKIKNRLVQGNLLPKSKFRKALGYFCGLIPHLKNYLNHPFARLDNNVAERAIRPLAIGRKNWLFVGSEDGGEAAAIVLSLIQTCRALGVNPREYLEDVMRRLMGHNIQQLYELLPDAWLKSRRQASVS
jgi:transposase